MNHLKLTLPIVILAGLVFGAVWIFDLFPGTDSVKADEDGLYIVKRGDLLITLTERGTFKARNSARVRVGDMRGGAKIEWIIEEGSEVKKGDIVVELEKTEAKNRIEQLESQVIQYESEKKAAITEEIIQEAQNKTDIEKASLNLEVAIVELKKLNEGDIPKKERELALAIEKGESDMKIAQRKVDANVELFKEDFVTQDQVERDEIGLKTCENALETAKLNKVLYEIHERPLELKQKSAAVVESERGLERAAQSADAQLDAKSAKVRQQTLSLQVAQDLLAQQQALLEQMTIASPANGVVLYGDPDRWSRDDEIKIGSTVYRNNVIATIPDPTEMSLTIQIHEADIEKLTEGMAAMITSETHRGRSFDGIVTKIDTVANAGNRWSGGDVKKFKVHVDVVGENRVIRTGTSAQVELQIGESIDVLFVPIQAVFARRGRFLCYVDKVNGVAAVTVQLGSSNGTHVEVSEGLEDGDRVLLYDPEITDELSESENEKPSDVAKSKERGRPGGERRMNRGESRGKPGARSGRGSGEKGSGRGGRGGERRGSQKPPS